MIEPRWIVLGVLLPAVVAAVVAVLFGGGWLSGRLRPPGGSLAVAGGFVAGFVATYGWPRLPPVESHDLILLVLLPAAVAVSLLCAAGGAWGWLSWLGRIVVAAGAPVVLLEPYLEHHWTGLVAVAWLCGLGAAGLAVWVVLLRLEARYHDRQSRCWLLWVWAVVAGATGMTTMLSGSQTLGQLGLTLAAVLLAVGGVAAVGRRLPAAGGMTDLPFVLLIGLWLGGYFYAELSTVDVLVLMVAPQAAWMGQLAPIQKLPLWQRNGVRLIAVVAVAATVVVVAAVKFNQEAVVYS